MATKGKGTPAKTQSVITAERVALNVMTRFNPIRGLVPQVLTNYLDTFDLGYLRNAAITWQKIKDRDDQVQTVSSKRELSASLLDWEILPMDDSPEAALHKQALEGFYNNLRTTHAMDMNVRGGVSTLIRQMMQAVGHKYAVHEIVWDPTGPDLTAEFRFTPLQFFENRTGVLRFLLTDFALDGIPLEDGGWMTTVGQGLMEPTSIAYLFKQLPLKDWVIYCEKFGIPGLHGATDAKYRSDEWNKMKDALQNFGVDWALLTSLNAKITPIEAGRAGDMPHPALVDRMDRAIARLWRGADLGTMSHSGRAVGSNPQKDETEILEAADAQNITETLNRQVDDYVIQYRFGTRPKAYFELQPRVQADQQVELQIDDYLISWGVPRAKKDLLQKYGRPEPDPGEELATASTNGAMPLAPPNVNPMVNEAGAVGREAIFKAASAAHQIAAKRVVFRPIAERLAKIYGIEDDDQRKIAVEKLREDAGRLAAMVVHRAPELAKPVQEIIGTALLSGVAEHGQKTAKVLETPKS